MIVAVVYGLLWLVWVVSTDRNNSAPQNAPDYQKQVLGLVGVSKFWHSREEAPVFFLSAPKFQSRAGTGFLSFEPSPIISIEPKFNLAIIVRIFSIEPSRP